MLFQMFKVFLLKQMFQKTEIYSIKSYFTFINSGFFVLKNGVWQGRLFVLTFIVWLNFVFFFTFRLIMSRFWNIASTVSTVNLNILRTISQIWMNCLKSPSQNYLNLESLSPGNLMRKGLASSQLQADRHLSRMGHSKSKQRNIDLNIPRIMLKECLGPPDPCFHKNRICILYEK